ncbi:MAG: hypothetical protein ABI556_07580 [Gemmatimonadales bacterium]
MTATSDTARQTALTEIETRENASKMVIIGAAMIESILFFIIFMVIDMSNQTHRLILLSALLVYIPVCLGMVALGIHQSRNTKRMLLAMQMLSEGRKA